MMQKLPELRQHVIVMKGHFCAQPDPFCAVTPTPSIAVSPSSLHLLLCNSIQKHQTNGCSQLDDCQ